MAYEIERVAVDDPMRCQAMTRVGQCPNKATVQGGMCPCHGGNVAVQQAEKESIRNYQLAKFQVEMNRHSDSPRLKTLNDEIAILRMTLEHHINQCQNASDLILKSHLISDLVMKVEKLVTSCHKLEASLGSHLDKQQILTFASSVIDVISAEVTDDAILGRISDGILKLVGEAGGDSE